MTLAAAAPFPARPSSALRAYSKIVSAAVFCLLFLGALVTSNNAGLTVPDWPTTYGQNMFTFPISKWQGGIFFEHGHRLAASAVGALILILAAWIAITDSRPGPKKIAGVLLLAVLTQGGLGGLTVLMLLPDWVSMLHGMLGQTVFLLTIAVAFSQSEIFMGSRGSLPADRTVFRISVFGLFLMYAQLFLGAWTRHSESGLAILDFPRMGGSLLPWANDAMLQAANSMRAAAHLLPVTEFQVKIHLAHRLGALVIAIFSIFFSLKLARVERSSADPTQLWPFILAFTAVQAGLGIVAVLSLRNPVITSLHVVSGAILLALYFGASLRTFPWKRLT